MEWQPIPTAPKDGENIDLWVKYKDGEGRVADCKFGEPDDDYGHLTPCLCQYTTDYSGYGEWGWYPVEGEPTYWMALPEPPK